MQVTFVTPSSFHILQRRIWIMFTWTFWSPSCRSSRSYNLMTLLFLLVFLEKSCLQARGAEVGSLLERAKMAIKFFAKRVFTIFTTNASFLRVIANLNQYNMQYIPCNSAPLAKETLFDPQKKHFFVQRFPKSE